VEMLKLHLSKLRLKDVIAFYDTGLRWTVTNLHQHMKL